MTNITRILISSVMVISIAVNASAESISTALPQGHRINSGAGTFSATGSILKIEQATPVLDTNWSSFDIGSQSSVSIVQPTSNSTFIARVQSGQVSEVNGAISANGRVVLTNPNGIIFGSASRVDVGGLVAAAGQLRSYDPAEERFSFDQLNGTITQDGVIAGDFVALVGGSIKQKGTIKTRAGDAALAAGDSVLMNLGPNGVLSVEVSAEEALGTIEQSGEIVAGGAAVIKADAAQKLLFEAVNGKSETKLVMRNGKLELVEISGIIAAKSIGIDAGDQGSVEVNSHLTATDGDKGGQIDVLGGSVVVSSAATLDVSGQSGGGIINVGGSWQNSDPTVRQSIVTYVEAGASLIADAKRQGDGGSIVVWSDVNNELSETSANGHFSAASLVGPGNGGRIETSGFSLNTERATGTAAAANGQPGMWLFDPYNITVSSTSTTNWDAGTGSTGSPSNISVETIKGLLESGTSVIIHTTGDGNGSEKGNIAWNADLLANLQNEVSLKLQAHGDISINNKIEATGDAALNVTLNTNLGGAADSNLVVNDYILTNGGDILIGGGSAGDASGFVTGNGVAVSINESIRSYGGDIVIRGKSTSASLAGAAGVLVSSKQIFSDAGQLSLYGEFESTHLEARGVRLDINDNIAGSVDSWLPAGSDSFSVEAARAVLHSSKATDNAIYISAINTGTSTNNAQIGLDVNWIGNMKSGAGNAANTAPFFANGGGNVVLTTGNSIGRIRVPAGVYINGNHGGEYHLITKSGFAATQYTTSGNTITLSSIGLTSVGGSWAPSLGTTGNPKTIIQTDTTDSLNFDFNSSGDLSIYGLTNSDVLNNNYSISVTKATSANTANVRLSSPLTNLRLTGGDVQLRNIEAKNVQVVANNIIVGHFDRSYNVLCGTNSGNIVACNSGFGSATNMVEKAYLRASISIRDDAENSDHYDAKLHVKELVLDSPVIDLRHGGWFNGTVDDSQAYGFTYHNIGKVAVKNADIAYISNANSIEIGSITTTAFDGSISDTLSTTVSGINASGASTRVIVETATGDLTVSANITSQGGGDGSNKHASQAASESLTEYFKFFTSVNGYKKVLTSNFMDWQNEANITRFGDYFDFPLILNAGFADTGHTNGSIVISGSPEITVEAGKKALLFTGGVDASVGLQSYVSDGKSRFGKRKSELYQPTVQTSAFFKDLASFSTGVTAVYRETPTINVAPTIASESITYGGQFDNAHDVTGFVGADTSATILRGTIEPSLNTTLSNSGNYNVGTYTLRYDNFTLTYKGLSNPYGYNIAYSTGTRTVDPKPLTVIYGASDRNYNGNKQAAVTPQISGNLIGDLVGLTQTAEFASENVQYVNGSVVDQAVSISITGKTGADSGNYSISTNEYSVLAKILPKTATLSGSRAYDGTDIIVSSDLTVSTGIADETLQLTGSATVNSKDVNDATHLSDVNSLTLQNSNNGLAGNYTLIADVGSSPFSIVKKKVQLTAEKVYDGKRSLDAAHFGNSLNTGVDGETLTLTGVAQANNAHVINAENIGSWDTLALGDGDGGLAANYALPAEGDVIVSVLPFELTLEPGSSVTKVYDGTNGSANLPMSFKLENWENKGLGINYDYSGGTFNSADVANANAFTYVTPSLTGIVDGNTSGNFDDGIGLISDFSISSSSSSAEVPGTITAYMLTANEMKFEVLGAVDASTSVYASNAVIFGLGGEVLTLDLDSGTSISHTNNASNARVAEGQNFNNVSLLKDDVQNLNYLLDTSNASPYQITAKKVVLSVVNGLNTFEKVYDGNNTALDFYSADDEDSSNNSIPSFWSLKDEDGVTYEHNFNGKKLYDIKSFGPLVVNRLLTFDAEFESKDAGDVSILITNVAFNDEYGLSDSFKSSYTFEPVNRINAKITPKPLSYIPINALDGNPVTFNNRLKKYYDGTADVSEALQFQLSSGIISGDVVSIDPPLEIEARDVDSNQLIVNRTAYRRMVSPVLSLSGEDASNYSVTVGADFKYGIPMDILPKILTLSATKTLDYTADFQLEAITLGGVVSGEAIELSKASYTKSGIQSSVLGQFLLKENTGLPDPNNQEQIDWFVEKTGTDSSEAANWLQGMKDQYDNAVDIAPLEIPFLSVTSNVDSEFTEVVDVGSHNLAIKMLSNGAASVRLSTSDNSVSTSNYCFASCEQLDGTRTQVTQLQSGDLTVVYLNGRATASITPPPTTLLTLSGFRLKDKVYDGSTSGQLSLVSLWGSLTGDFAGNDADTVSLVTSNATFTYASKNVGTSISVIVDNLGLAGTNAEDYRISSFTTTAAITAKAITVSGITAANKVYDGVTAATVNTSGASGWLANDVVTVASTGVFDDKNVGTGKTVSLTSSYSGTDAGNYIFTDQANALASIFEPQAETPQNLATITSVTQAVLSQTQNLVSNQRALYEAGKVLETTETSEETNEDELAEGEINIENVLPQRSDAVKQALIPIDETMIVTVAENTLLTRVNKPVVKVKNDETQFSVGIAEIVGISTLAPEDQIVLTIPGTETTADWASFDRETQTIVGDIPENVGDEAFLRVVVADPNGNLVAVSLEISAETPTDVPGAENSPLSSGQQTAAIPGFLSIESLRPQEVEVGDSFAFEVEPTTFVHENSGEPLQYVATKADGGPLPSWVDFDAESLTFSGQAPTNAQEKLDVIVKAIDSASQQAQVQMRIDVRKQ